MPAGRSPTPRYGYAGSLLDLFRRLRADGGDPSLRTIASLIPGSTSPGHLSNVFNGKKIPSPQMAESIAKALGAGDDDRKAASFYADAAVGDEQPGPEVVLPWRVETFVLAAPQVPKGAAPSALLSARFRVVDFAGRVDDLRDLAAWRDDTNPVLGTRLVHGLGGQGKTRLAAEFASRSAGAGWVVGKVRHRTDVARPAKTLSPTRLGAAEGLLLVIDYAERWPVEDLITCLTSYQAGIREGGRSIPVRVLLLARPAGGWWQGIRAKLAEYDITAVSDVELLPLVPDPDDREQLFNAARERFAAVLDVDDGDEGEPPPRLAIDAEFGRALTVQMAALVAVDAAARGATPPSDPADLSTYLLDRERRHWQEIHAKARAGDGGGTDEAAIATNPAVMARTVFTATVTRPLPYPAGVTALIKAGAAGSAGTGADAGRVLADHAVCYPPTNQATVLEPLYPDRLAEDFLAAMLPGGPGRSADPWAASALTALLIPDPSVGPPSYVRQSISVLVAAAQRHPHLGRDHLFPLFSTHPELAVAAGGAALTTLIETPDIDLRVLEAIEPLLPTDRHTDLDIAAAAISGTLIAHRLTGTTDPAEQARLHAAHALRLSNAGRRQEALASSQRAVDLYRELARTDPGPHLQALAVSLTNHGIRLSEVGRREDALAPTEEAVAIRRLLPKDSSAHLSELALALNNLAARLSEVGRREDALAPMEEATGICLRLGQAEPATYLRDLAMSRNNLGALLVELGRSQDALSCAEEAVDLYRQLADIDPDSYLPPLGGALNNMGMSLLRAGRSEQGVAPVMESVAIRRRLARTNPAAYLPDLAMSLNNLGTQLSTVGRPEEAMAPAERAV